MYKSELMGIGVEVGTIPENCRYYLHGKNEILMASAYKESSYPLSIDSHLAEWFEKENVFPHQEDLQEGMNLINLPAICIRGIYNIENEIITISVCVNGHSEMTIYNIPDQFYMGNQIEFQLPKTQLTIDNIFMPKMLEYYIHRFYFNTHLILDKNASSGYDIKDSKISDTIRDYYFQHIMEFEPLEDTIDENSKFNQYMGLINEKNIFSPGYDIDLKLSNEIFRHIVIGESFKIGGKKYVVKSFRPKLTVPECDFDISELNDVAVYKYSQNVYSQMKNKFTIATHVEMFNATDRKIVLVELDNLKKMFLRTAAPIKTKLNGDIVLTDSRQYHLTGYFNKKNMTLDTIPFLNLMRNPNANNTSDKFLECSDKDFNCVTVDEFVKIAGLDEIGTMKKPVIQINQDYVFMQAFGGFTNRHARNFDRLYCKAMSGPISHGYTVSNNFSLVKKSDFTDDLNAEFETKMEYKSDIKCVEIGDYKFKIFMADTQFKLLYYYKTEAIGCGSGFINNIHVIDDYKIETVPELMFIFKLGSYMDTYIGNVVEHIERIVSDDPDVDDIMNVRLFIDEPNDPPFSAEKLFEDMVMEMIEQQYMSIVVNGINLTYRVGEKCIYTKRLTQQLLSDSYIIKDIYIVDKSFTRLTITTPKKYRFNDDEFAVMATIENEITGDVLETVIFSSILPVYSFHGYQFKFEVLPWFDFSQGHIKMGAKLQMLENVAHNAMHFKSKKCYFQIKMIIPHLSKDNSIVLFHNGRTLPLGFVRMYMKLADVKTKATQTVKTTVDIYAGIPEPEITKISRYDTRISFASELLKNGKICWNKFNGFVNTWSSNDENELGNIAGFVANYGRNDRYIFGDVKNIENNEVIE